MSIYDLQYKAVHDESARREMCERYSAMVNVLSDILACGRWDIEELFDSKNNIEVGEIVKDWVNETGTLPTWNTVYYEALANFASEHDLEVGQDVDIYTNACLDTHLYAREGLDESVIEEMSELFNMDVNIMK